jgi:hypothetical protein
MIGHNNPPRAEWESNPAGWVVVSRELRNHPIVGAGRPVPPADPRRGADSRMEAWLDLVCLAQYKQTRVPRRGRVMTLDVGQLMGSRRWLATRWNWSEKTVRHFLEVLEAEGMISFIHNDRGPIAGGYGQTLGNVITVCNYSKYQLYSDLITDQMKRLKGPDRGLIGARSRGPIKGPDKGPIDAPEDAEIAMACAEGWAGKGPDQGPTQGPTPEPERGHILTTNNKKEEDTPPTPQGGQPALIEPPEPKGKRKATQADALACFEAWNALALRLGLPQSRTLTPQWSKQLIARLNEHGGVEAWTLALANVERSAFLQGKTKTDSNWRASFPFMLQASSFAKVVDGVYGNGAHAEPEKPKQPAPEMAPWLRDALERVRRNGY